MPGAGHLLIKKPKGRVLLVALCLMCSVGRILEGRLYQFDTTPPLNWVYAVGGHGLGVSYAVARSLAYGTGRVEAVTSNTAILTWLSRAS